MEFVQKPWDFWKWSWHLPCPLHWQKRDVTLIRSDFLHWFFYLYRRSLECVNQHELYEPAYANGMLHGSHCLECADFWFNHDCWGKELSFSWPNLTLFQQPTMQRCNKNRTVWTKHSHIIAYICKYIKYIQGCRYTYRDKLPFWAVFSVVSSLIYVSCILDFFSKSVSGLSVWCFYKGVFPPQSKRSYLSPSSVLVDHLLSGWWINPFESY